MSTDPTEAQGGRDRRQSREMSLKRGHPPAQVPGYEPERFLGAGAYGEVWVARERNTGRRVAIKFYAHRGGLDWSLLSREVEKLAFLFADRYVVQLLGVGWDADPPYYVMEYLERGSLADRLQQGPLPVDEAISLFRDVAVGLVHAHGKGVLHCDVKPGNVLLDQDNKPRLADFGQSRLSHEQVPALGTLFYMAPEQADIEAMPDARWDVYALGALLFCMLTGGPPHRTGKAVADFEKTPQLIQRLSRYRKLIEESPAPTGHRHVRGVDRALSEIIERCLAVDPAERFPNIQAVLEALDDRAARRARRPMVILGAVGPAMLLAVVTWFAWQGFSSVIDSSDSALTDRALQSNRFAAQFVARTAANELERRYEAVEQLAERLASSDQFRELLGQMQSDPRIQELWAEINQPDLDETQRARLCREFRDSAKRQAVQKLFADLTPEADVASWFFCNARGISMVRTPESDTLGKNFAWRSYFHGQASDWSLDGPQVDPAPPLDHTHLSAVFPSQATSQWIVAVSAPVVDRSADKEEFLGVVALTVELGRFVELQRGNRRASNKQVGNEQLGNEQFAVLVDWRDGDNKGVVLQHPLLNRMLDEKKKLPDRFKDYRVAADDLPRDNEPQRQVNYHDPFARDVEGRDKYDKRWLARIEEVRVRNQPTGWVVIVQEGYDVAIGATLHQLRSGLIRYGLTASALIIVVLIGLWTLTNRISTKG